MSTSFEREVYRCRDCRDSQYATDAQWAQSDQVIWFRTGTLSGEWGSVPLTSEFWLCAAHLARSDAGEA